MKLNSHLKGMSYKGASTEALVSSSSDANQPRRRGCGLDKWKSGIALAETIP